MNDTPIAGFEDEEITPIGPDELSAAVESLQRRLESGAISLEDFEAEKEFLAARLAAVKD